ncbi:hypothetical protein FBU59_005500 [Linderina macrospora]|uniref:Uncharacterized protein n=1 Tax=Linderina macrospora TaxID=4868 RepID=A0ACC1J2K8_9FUNG|nr:hypothetical protein FBU59_005500 [Linderina macrospora]
MEVEKYEEKCREHELMAKLYKSKCHAFNELEAKYNRLLERRKTVDVVPSLDVSDNNQSTSKVPPPQSEPAAVKRPADHTTPTKRRRTETTMNNLRSLLSSSPPMFQPMSHVSEGLRRRRKARVGAAKLAPVADSSQTTQMDESDVELLQREKSIVLCPPSDEEPDKPEVRVSSPPHMVLPKSSGVDGNVKLEGGCAICREFYSGPGVVMTKGDLGKRCTHGNSKNKVSPRLPGRPSRAAPLALMPIGAQNKGRIVAPQSRPKGGRQTTPDNFWDIDYFPPIRTGGPEALRKQKN